MQSKIVAALSGMIVATASVAHAQDRHRDPWTADRGVQLGVRVGYGLGVGEVYSGLDVTDAAYGSVPVIIDLGARVTHRLYIGVYGQIAPVVSETDPTSWP